MKKERYRKYPLTDGNVRASIEEWKGKVGQVTFTINGKSLTVLAADLASLASLASEAALLVEA